MSKEEMLDTAMSCAETVEVTDMNTTRSRAKAPPLPAMAMHVYGRT